MVDCAGEELGGDILLYLTFLRGAEISWIAEIALLAMAKEAEFY